MQFDLNAHIIFKKGSVQIDYSLFEHNMMEYENILRKSIY